MARLEFSRYNAGRHWLIGASSYLVDRVIPACEEILLPEAVTSSGYLQINVAEQLALSRSQDLGAIQSPLENIFHYLRINKVKNIKEELVLDFRVNSPFNWAHAFTNHLPLALYVRRDISKEFSKDILIVLPKNISKKIIELFISVGFKVLVTNSRVFGRMIFFDMKPWVSIRGLRHKVFRDELSTTELYSKVLAVRSAAKDKVFISRKDTRKIFNEHEISSYLQSEGYSTIYLEDYSLVEQIALLCYAKKIVAIHGAGLGPLLLKNVFTNESYELVEIFTPAHMTTCFRVITHQLGGRWIGVRGRIWPKLIRYVYTGKVMKFSLNDFFVDIESVKIALVKIKDKIVK